MGRITTGKVIQRCRAGGIELDLLKDDELIERKMIFEGTNKYYYENIEPGHYSLKHAHDGVLWRKEIVREDVIWENAFPGETFDNTADKATITETLSEIGKGEKVLGKLALKIVPGKESGKIIVIFKYENP